MSIKKHGQRVKDKVEEIQKMLGIRRKLIHCLQQFMTVKYALADDMDVILKLRNAMQLPPLWQIAARLLLVAGKAVDLGSKIASILVNHAGIVLEVIT